MRIGNLVKYKKRDTPSLGVVVGRKVFGGRWIVQWTNGKKYSENEIHLEVLCE